MSNATANQQGEAFGFGDEVDEEVVGGGGGGAPPPTHSSLA